MKSDQFQLHAAIEEKHWWFRARRRIMRALLHQVLPPSREVTVLDVGCGTGGNIAHLAGEYDAIGIDTSEQAISLARSRYPGVDFRCGIAPEDVSDRVEDVDAFLLMDVLEHVPDDFLLLSSLLAASRPGAYFLLTVPADAGLWSEHDVSFGHYRRYDRARLEMLWAGLPVTPLLVSYYNTRLYPLVKFARSRSQARAKAGGMAGTDFRVPRGPANGLLEWLFATETAPLTGALGKGQPAPFAAGVSLIALLRREPGEIVPRCKPSDAPPDLHDPEGSP